MPQALPDLQAPAIRAEAKKLRPMALEYLAKKALAAEIREQVDAIQRRLLAEECPLYKDLERNERIQAARGEDERIIDPKDYWLAEDQDALNAYYAAQDRELRAAGLKPDCMDFDYCPALVAENNAGKVRWALLDAMAPMIGLRREQLWGAKEDQFFDLAMKLILNA